MPPFTKEQQAEEVTFIRTRPWVLDPFLPMKKLTVKPGGGPGAGPDCGFIHKLNGVPEPVVYLGFINDLVTIDESFGRMEEQLIGAGGAGHKAKVFHYEPRLKEPLPTQEQLQEGLKKMDSQRYDSLEAMVADGWVVD